MKTSIFILLIICGLKGFSQEDKLSYKGAFEAEDWTRIWTNYNPNKTQYPEADIILTGLISENKTLSNKHVYLLKGTVYVLEGVTLTIEQGTIIRGDNQSNGTLVITQGAKIEAKGTMTNPIVFTSNQIVGNRKPGDWGGIILLGKAPVSKIGGISFLEGNFDKKLTFFGGEKIEDNSGNLDYLRIEYAGHQIDQENELNGLTLAGIGKNTKLKHIQISYAKDDSFEFFGGNLTLSHLISYKCGDDDFDFTQGFHGVLDFVVALRHPFISDYSGSRCVEINTSTKEEDFYKNRRTEVSITHATFLMIGLNKITKAAIREAIFLDSHANLSVEYSIFSGFKYAIKFANEKGKEELLIDRNVFQNNLVAESKSIVIIQNKYDENMDWFQRPKYNNVEIEHTSELIFENALKYDLRPIQKNAISSK